MDALVLARSMVLWRYAIDSQPATDDELPRHQINLRFSVATPEIQVISHEPTAGRLDINTPMPCQVAVRLPAGEEHAFVITAGNATTGQPQMITAQQGYIHFVAPDGQAQVFYPLQERVRPLHRGRR